MKNKQYLFPKSTNYIFTLAGIFLLGVGYSLYLENEWLGLGIVILLGLAFTSVGIINLSKPPFVILEIDKDGVIFGKNMMGKREYTKILWQNIYKISSGIIHKRGKHKVYEKEALVLNFNPSIDLNGVKINSSIRLDQALGEYKVEGKMLKPETVQDVVRRIEKAKLTYEKWGII